MFCSYIGKMTKLVRLELDLRYNSISDSNGGMCIGSSLDNLVNLSYLELDL